MTMPRLLDPRDIDARRILVIAPHPDDESLGCGGLMVMLAAGGRQIHTLFVTDGGASHPASKSWPRQRLASQRESEAAEALARLGLGNQPRSFLRLRDADMPQPGSAEWTAARDRVEQLLAGFRPDLVLLPWRRDPHRDHRDSWRLSTEAIAASGRAIATMEYAIWLDEFGQLGDRPAPDEAEFVAFDVSHLRVAKRQAVAAHLSQTTALIDDDPDGFLLGEETIARLTGPLEIYVRPWDG
ncbi:PIG-L family deacetylase [Jiella endophytica]|uniref:PIG-L family deacetylase n=2 Tax=Jiella endophytica TaxID=2558362 RepID=A0A4Y8R9Q5_9HYPH|nr:PIG-L family deacetylase [Jiella endophytica]